MGCMYYHPRIMCLRTRTHAYIILILCTMLRGSGAAPAALHSIGPNVTVYVTPTTLCNEQGCIAHIYTRQLFPDIF